MVHQDTDEPWMCVDCVIPAVLRLSCRGTFKPVVHFCISLLKAHSDGNNCQEQRMGGVQLLRGRAWEGARANVSCVPARVRVCLSPDQWLYKGHAPPKSEMVCQVKFGLTRSSPEFTPTMKWNFHPATATLGEVRDNHLKAGQKTVWYALLMGGLPSTSRAYQTVYCPALRRLYPLF